MDTLQDLDFLTDQLSEADWYFSPEVVRALEGVGITPPKGLRSFIFILQSSEIVLESEIEVTILGLGLRLKRQGLDIYVDLLLDFHPRTAPDSNEPGPFLFRPARAWVPRSLLGCR